VNLFTGLFSGFLLLIFILIIFYNSYLQYQYDIKQIETDYIISQKKFVEQETKRVLQYIKYRYEHNNDLSKEDLQKEIVEVIEETRNVADGTGYVFIYTFDGINIADPILKKNAGKNLINFTDKNGKRVIYELIQASKEKNGGFVKYVWNKPTTNTLSPKISYAISFEPWQWMIGSGVYLDNVELKLNQKKQEYFSRVGYYIIQIIVIITILYTLGILIYRYLMIIIQHDIQQIKNASENLTLIDKNEVAFKEFKVVACHLNDMTTSLTDLNKNLEQKVKIRTKELQDAKEYAMNLVENQDRFIKDAIHEINTPLGIIIANVDLFIMKYGKNRYLSKIEAGSKIIHNIYNDLEYMIKKDRIEYKPKKINFSSFLMERCDFFDEIAQGNGLCFEISIEQNIMIYFNETHLQRLIDNSISNAIKYSLPDKKIKIVLHKRDNNVELIISNYSKTIKNPEKLFGRYYRENDVRGGFGIGLNIIKEICDKNDVDVEVKSKQQLTTFRYNFKIL
jgi:signal transduction histidine kinase